jgi:hypothetical protein
MEREKRRTYLEEVRKTKLPQSTTRQAQTVSAPAVRCSPYSSSDVRTLLVLLVTVQLAQCSLRAFNVALLKRVLLVNLIDDLLDEFERQFGEGRWARREQGGSARGRHGRVL